MEWVDNLKGKVVGLDTAPLIYFIEENSAYLEIVRPFFEAVDHGDFQVVTSVVTLLEVLVQPLRTSATEIAQQYREILTGAIGLTTVDLSRDIAEEAARLRASHHIRTPDAIQIATAIRAGASFFLTNDTRLPSLPGLTLLLLDDLKVSSS